MIGCLWRDLFCGGTLVLALAGCSQSGFESSVTGSVTLDGKVLGQGLVVFAPQEGGGNPSNGTIQRNGNYSVKTSNMPGLRAGKYRVSVSALDSPNPPPGVRDTTPPKQLVPEKYTDVNTSGLQYDVTAGSNTFNIELSSK